LEISYPQHSGNFTNGSCPDDAAVSAVILFIAPLHPPVFLYSLDLLLACLIWCSTLVSKLTFSPGPFLHSFSQ